MTNNPSNQWFGKTFKRWMVLLTITSLAITTTVILMQRGGQYYWAHPMNLHDKNTLKREATEDVKREVIDFAALDRVHKERRERALAQCSGMKSGKGIKSLENSYYDPVSNGLYCSVPKVGCSTWKRIFLVLSSNQSGDPLALSGLDIHKDLTLRQRLLCNQPKEVRHRLVEESFSFMFSRNPFRRIFSGYCDKLFMTSGVTSDGFARSIRQSIRKSKSQADGGKGFVYTGPELNVTFAELLRHVSSIKDPHFAPISSTCHPCQIPFTVMGQMEYFEQDTEYVLAKLNRSDIMENYRLHTAQSNQSRELGIVEELVQRSFGILSPPRKKSKDNSFALRKYKLLARMWKVFHIRGLVSDTIPFPLNVSMAGNVTQELMTSLASQAQSQSDEPSVLEAQREKYYRQAFRSVPLETLKSFSDFAQTDCKLFGYDCTPPDIFAGRETGDEEENIFSSDRWIYESAGIPV